MEERDDLTMEEIAAVLTRHGLSPHQYGGDVAAALLRLEQERLADIVRVSHASGGLRVTLASANELAFDVALEPTHSYDETIADICQVVPALMRYDADLTEAYDDAGRTKPSSGDHAEIRRFTMKYRDRLSNCQVDFGGFPQG